MRIEKFSGGWRITVPETENNSEFQYDVPIMTTGPKEIGERQRIIARKVAILCFSMENFFKSLPTNWDEYWKNNTKSPFDKWSEDNGEDWNEHFHWGCKELVDEAWDLMHDWHMWHFDTYGWTAL